MKRVIVLAVMMVEAKWAQEPKMPEAPWVSLFNGKDLTNWVPVGAEKWEVENGVIHGQGVTKAYGYLMTEKIYTDFDFSLRFKCEAEGNSGVFFHAGFKTGEARLSGGMQVEIDRDPNRHTGAVYGSGRGRIAWPAAELGTIIQSNDWNHLLVSVRGNRYITRLNGVVMVDFIDPTPKTSKGHIALQLHSGGKGNMRFKDIWIRDLSSRTAAGDKI